MSADPPARLARPAAGASAPARRRSRPALVAEVIKDWVAAQGLRPGDRLPGEAELMGRFGMAKGTIREAMRILEGQGLVRTRTGPGGGSFVAEVTEERARALLANYFFFRGLTVGDVYALRRLLEPEMAAGLAGRLSAADLAGLEEITRAYDHPAADLEEERAQHVASLRFHARLAELAGNELLGFLVGFMAQVLSELTLRRGLYAPMDAELRATGLASHRALLAALREGDAEAARATMRAHMERAGERMRDREAQALAGFLSA